MDDELHEEAEELRLVLGTARGTSPFGAAVGEQNETLIRIRDDADSKKPPLCSPVDEGLMSINVKVLGWLGQ